MNRRKIVIPVILLILIAVAVWFWLRSREQPGDTLSSSGTVEATEARLGFEIPGQITAIAVHEGDRVKAGDPLARLDPEEWTQRRQQAEARVETSEAMLRELEHGSRPEEIAQARSAVEAASAKVEDAHRDLERARTLFHGGAISAEGFDKAQTATTLAEKNLAQANEQLRLVRQGPRSERVDAARSQVSEAEAGVRTIEASMKNLVITSPVDGIVTVRHREPNETVAPGQPVVTVMNPGDRWVRIYIPEDRIGAVHLGAPALIHSDTYPDKRYEGRVSYIASEAEFTPKNVQTTEERVRLVYAVKVRITDDPKMELKPGMPVDVTVGTEATVDQ